MGSFFYVLPWLIAEVIGREKNKHRREEEQALPFACRSCTKEGEQFLYLLFGYYKVVSGG